MSKRKKSINVIAYLSVANATDKNVDWKEEKQLSYISEYAKAHNLRIIKIMHKNIMGCSVVNTHFNKQVLQSKQYNCIYSDRKIDWRSNIQEDWEDLYSYLSNGCDTEKISVSSFSNLSAKGYVVDGENQVTVINVKDGNLVTVINNFVANHIQIPKFIFEEGKKVDERLYEVNKSKYPEHLEKLVRYNNSNAFTWGEFIPYIVERMLEVGMLKPLTQKQKKAVFTVVAIDC